MASNLLGRCTCPLCGNQNAHVKIKTDKADGKPAYPYIHCREENCGCQLHTRNRQQAEWLAKKTRPEKGQESPEPISEELPGTVEPISPELRNAIIDEGVKIWQESGRFGRRL